MFMAGKPHHQLKHFNRCIYGAYWLVILIILATYTGHLTASLAVDTPAWPFDNLQQFAEADDWPLYVNQKETIFEVVY